MIDPVAKVANGFIQVFGLLPGPVRSFVNLALGIWFAMALLLLFYRLK